MNSWPRSVGLVASEPVTLKIGIQPNQTDSQRASPMVRPCEEEQRPEAIDHARHRRHQVHQRDQGALDPLRCDLGDEQGHAERDRDGDDHRHQGDEDGAGHDAGDAEVVDVRLPGLGGEEGELGDPDRREGLDREEETDGGEHEQHDERTRAVQPSEQPVAQPGNCLGAAPRPLVEPPARRCSGTMVVAIGSSPPFPMVAPPGGLLGRVPFRLGFGPPEVG